MLKIVGIGAMDLNKMIGYQNDLPWNCPLDLKFFKENTLNKTIVMGSNTYRSIGMSLPNRRNIVLSKTSNFKGVETYTSVEDILKLNEDLMIIGGNQIYKLFKDYYTHFIITSIKHTFKADTKLDLNFDDKKLIWRSGIKKCSNSQLELEHLIYKF